MLDFSARVRNTRRIPYRKVVVGVNGNFGTDLDLSMIVGMVFHGESGRRVGALQQFDVLSHRKPITLADSRSPKKERFNGVEFARSSKPYQMCFYPEPRDCILWPIRTWKDGGATALPISVTGSGEPR